MSYEQYWVDPILKLERKGDDDFYKTNMYKGNEPGWFPFPFLVTPNQTAPKRESYDFNLHVGVWVFKLKINHSVQKEWRNKTDT